MEERESSHSGQLFLRKSTDEDFYVFRIKKTEFNRTLAVLAFWFAWSQRNEIASLPLLIKGLFE